MRVERERLISPLSVCMFGALVVLAALLIFSQQRLAARIHKGEANALSIAYMEAWLRGKPDDTELWTVLAQEYIAVGELDRAGKVIDRLQGYSDPGLSRQVLLMRISLAEHRQWNFKSDDERHIALQAQVRTLIQTALTQEWDAPTLQMLAASATASGDTIDAITIYRRLAVVDSAQAEHWNQIADQLGSTGSENYQVAADINFHLQETAVTLEDRRRYYIQAVRVLQSSNVLVAAFEQAQRHLTAELASDPETLRFLIRFSLACNRADAADSYAKKLLSADPGSWAFGQDAKPSAKAAKAANAKVSDAAQASDGVMWMPGLKRVATAAIGNVGYIYLDGPRGAESAHRSHIDQAGILRAAYVAPASAPILDANGQPLAPGAISSSQPGKKSSDASSTPTPAGSDADIELSYNVFMANRDLMAALNATNIALARHPQSVEWLERRAQVLEWSNQGGTALQSWKRAAELSNSEKDWAAVLRLAPGVHDDTAYLAALRHQAAGNRVDPKLSEDIIDALERLDQPDQALLFLQQQMGSARPQELLRRYALLAERMGRDQLALETYLELNRRFGPSVEYATELSNLYLQNGQLREAGVAMASASSVAKDNDIDYWRRLESLAQLNHNDLLARQAAQHLLLNSKATPTDLTEMLQLWEDLPLDAGRLAELIYQRGKDPAYLTQAIFQYNRARAWGRTKRLLASLTPEQITAAEKSPDYLMAKAEYLRATGDADGALDSLRRGTAFTPVSDGLRFNYLWTLIDRGSDNELRQGLLRWQSAAEHNPQLWGVYAAGWLRLQDAPRARHFFELQAPQKKNDPLWALAYADALEEFGQPDEALGIRMQVWAKMRARRQGMFGGVSASPNQSGGALQDGVDDDTREELRARSVTLTEVFQGADASKALLVELLRADYRYARPQAEEADRLALPQKILSDADANVEIKLDPSAPKKKAVAQRLSGDTTAGDVALAWSMSTEPFELARDWLARHYAEVDKRPVYAEAEIALRADDRPALAHLLDTVPDRMPYLNRIDANLRLDRTGEAKRLAYEGLMTNPDSDELHARLLEAALFNPSFAEAGLTSFRQSPLAYVEQSVLGRRALGDHYSVLVHYLVRHQHTTDDQQLVNVPNLDRQFGGALAWKTGQTNLSFDLSHREAVTSFNSALFEGSWAQLNKLSFGATLGYNQEATESVPLRVGGSKDMVGGSITWRFATREFIEAQVQTARYYAQDRTYLGRGNQFDIEAGYRFRVEYPDYTIRAVLGHGSYSQSGSGGPIFARLLPNGVTDILPVNDTQAGLMFDFGQDYRRSYTRAWKPFADAGYMHSTGDGWGLVGSIGAAGSVFGNDHAVIYYSHDRSLRNGSAPSTEGGVRYRWYF